MMAHESEDDTTPAAGAGGQCPSWDALEQFVSEGVGVEPIQRHLHACPSCREMVEHLQRDNNLINVFAEASSEDAGEVPTVALAPCVDGYEVLSEIHRGGQGIVYKAVQKATKRKVALKTLLPRALASKRQQHRFEREIEIIAQLRHPHIVTIYDSGTTTDGRHYFAMEYLRGQKLDDYIRSLATARADTDGSKNGMPVVEKILRLFLKICDAVQYAHLRGIIHRDLKPANIVIDRQGEPHILDFGLAKVFGSDSPLEISMATQTGEFMGTFAYAAPEQVKGDPELLDTRTDIYALGVILYEMLTGAMPYGISGALSDVIRNIIQVDPVRPSALRRGLDDDVDTIVLKALAKDRDRRYQSVDSMGRDVLRFLANEPIDAKRDSSWYFVRKLIRRHRVGVAAAIFMVVILLGGVAATTWQASLAHRQRNLAEAARQAEMEQRKRAEANFERARQAEGQAHVKAQTAESVTQFLVDLFAASDPFADLDRRGPASDVTAQNLLNRGAERIAKELSEQPQTRAALQCAMGKAYGGLGLCDRADELLSNALQTQLGLFGERHLEVASSQFELGSLRVNRGRYFEAESLFRKALETRRALLELDDAQLAESQAGLALALGKLEKFEEAVPLFREALTAFRQKPSHAMEQAKTLGDFADMLERQGKYDEAESCLNEVSSLYRTKYGEEHPLYVKTLGRFARLRMSQGNWPEAVAGARQAVAKARAQFGEDHPVLAEQLQDLGTILYNNGQFPEAEQTYRDALVILRGSFGKECPDVATTMDSLASTLEKEGRYEEAEPLYNDALVMHRRVHGNQHSETARCLLNYGSFLRVKGRNGEAEQMYLESLKINRMMFGPEHIRVATALSALATLIADQGRNTDSEPRHREALALQRRLLGNKHPHVVLSLTQLGRVLTDMGRLSEAELQLQEAIELLGEMPEYKHQRRAKTYLALADVFRLQGKYELAREPLRKAFDVIQAAHLSPDHIDRAEPLRIQGSLLVDLDQAAEAEPLLRESWRIRHESQKDHHRATALAANTLGHCLSLLGRGDEAEPLLLGSFPTLLELSAPEGRQFDEALAHVIGFVEARDNKASPSEPKTVLLSPEDAGS